MWFYRSSYPICSALVHVFKSSNSYKANTTDYDLMIYDATDVPWHKVSVQLQPFKLTVLILPLLAFSAASLRFPLLKGNSVCAPQLPSARISRRMFLFSMVSKNNVQDNNQGVQIDQRRSAHTVFRRRSISR